MHNNIYYQSSLTGEKLYLGRNSIYFDMHDLFDYSWEASDNGLPVRSKKSRLLPLWFIGKDSKTCSMKRNEAYRIFDQDVIYGKPGKLYVNDYFLECLFVAATNDSYFESERWLKTSYTIECDDPSWRFEADDPVYTNIAEGTSAQSDTLAVMAETRYFGFPFNFPFDFGQLQNNSASIPDTSGGSSSGMSPGVDDEASGTESELAKFKYAFSSDFRLVIYGPCTNPMITINGHTYGLKMTMVAGERVEIISRLKDSKTQWPITYYGPDGLGTNGFRYRCKTESIFEKIPAGNLSISWSDGVGFELFVDDARSEPIWNYSESWRVETDIDSFVSNVGATTSGAYDSESEETNYLTDSDGGYILDSDGERIEVS